MNKSFETVCSDFYEQYKLLNESDKELFSRVCNKLLTNNFIYGQIKEDKDDYYAILRLKEEIKSYFYLINYTLGEDSGFKLFFLRSAEGAGRIRLKKMESILVLLFRKFYYVRSKETGSSVKILVTFDELIDEINRTKIYKERMNKVLLKSALLVLRRYKLIDFNAVNYANTDTFEIFPTILYVVKTEDVKIIEDKLASYTNAEGEDEEDETDED